MFKRIELVVILFFRGLSRSDGSQEWDLETLQAKFDDINVV